MLILSIGLYIFAAVLFFYIVYSIAKTRKFKTGDALSALGISVTLILATGVNPALPQSPIISTPTSGPNLNTQNPTETPLPGNILFVDNFNSGTTAKWINNLSTSSYKDGEMYIGNGYLISGSSQWQNYSVRANIRLISGGGYDFSIVARFIDMDNFYMCQFYKGGNLSNVLWLQLVHTGLTGGADTLAQNISGLNFDSNAIRMDVQNDVITCYLNGNVIATGTDSTFPSGKFGFRVYSQTMAVDNVEVDRLP